MCLLCVIQIPLYVCFVLACIQFGLWFISAGVFICSQGLYGVYVERYTRWAFCFLMGGCLILYFVLIGISLGNRPHTDWAKIVSNNIKNLFITDYEEIERRTSKMHYLNLETYPKHLEHFATLGITTLPSKFIRV